MGSIPLKDERGAAFFLLTYIQQRRSEKMSDKNNGAITDARKLGIPKMLILGIQHTFAMFGATVLVPLLTGLDVATTLLMAGLGTLLFHLLTKGKVPAFLGSSFAFLGGYAAVAPAAGKDGLTQAELLPYACLGVACAGLLYLVLAAIIKLVGVSKVMKFFPPIVTGPIIIAIGLSLAGSAVNNCRTCWPIAIIALLSIVIFNIWGRGMAKIIPILLGIGTSVVVAIILAAVCGQVVTITAADGSVQNFICILGDANMKLFDVGKRCRVRPGLVSRSPAVRSYSAMWGIPPVRSAPSLPSCPSRWRP